jgi:hypothetical protein
MQPLKIHLVGYLMMLSVSNYVTSDDGMLNERGTVGGMRK